MILLVSLIFDPFLLAKILTAENLGASICGCFVFFGALSVALYKPWRRWIEHRRTRPFLEDEGNNVDGADEPPSNDLGITQSRVEAIQIRGKNSII